MDYPQKVTKTLYDNNGFIADDFNDSEMRELYDDLKVNRLQYEELFRNFGCTLRFEDKCFYLTRTKVTRQAIESRMEDYYLWIRMLMKGMRGHNLNRTLVYMRTPPDMYKRRGGVQYAKDMLRFHWWVKRSGWSSMSDFITGAVPHAIVCVLPNRLRKIVYEVLHK